MSALIIKILNNKQDLLNYYTNTNQNIYEIKHNLQSKNINKDEVNNTLLKNVLCKDINNSGLDIITPTDTIVPANSHGFKIPLGIAYEPINLYKDIENTLQIYFKKEANGTILCPRSSIIKTPLRLANSLGIIDSCYRGEIIAAVDNISNQDFKIIKGQRLFQICNYKLTPINYILSDELSDTERGNSGFGSSGK